MNATPHPTIQNHHSQRTSPRGFSMTELLVVIGIIVLLVGILLVALDTVQQKAKKVKTVARMQAFADSCNAFQLDHGFYPGVVPEEIFVNEPNILMSSTENALLHLMGGFVREEDVGTTAFTNNYLQADGWETISFTGSGSDYRIKVNIQRMGEGPTIEGKTYAPYYTPGTGELITTTGQHFSSGSGIELPDLVDAWGQPIAFLRQARTIGPLTDDNPMDTQKPQFYIKGMLAYVESVALGAFGNNQTSSNGNEDYSILHASGVDQNETLAQIIRHPAFGASGTQGDAFNGTPRGSYYLFSAGSDGVFFSRKDGPTTKDELIEDITLLSPKIVEEYDDTVISGGG